MGYEKDFSRRDFLKTTGAAGIGLLASAAVPPALGAQDSNRVPTRPFGKTGANVAILSMGGMFDMPSNQLMLRQAVKWGVTYWDTANSYEGGNSELGIGKYFAARRISAPRAVMPSRTRILKLMGLRLSLLWPTPASPLELMTAFDSAWGLLRSTQSVENPVERVLSGSDKWPRISFLIQFALRDSSMPKGMRFASSQFCGEVPVIPVTGTHSRVRVLHW